MQFLSTVLVPCDRCQGKRFNPETLEIRYRGKTIHEILEMTVQEATAFFARHRKIHRILSTLEQVGLGYLSLGQKSTTLSGGEAQRIKLASELQRPASGRTLYLLDEPTTGLHMADIEHLLAALQRLVDDGNTVVVIEHNTDVIRAADHIIDLGPEGGIGGGRLTGAGTPEELARLQTPTGVALRAALGPQAVSRLSPARRRRAQVTDIQLRGVHTHNLRGIDVDLQRGAMTVVTGVSGSGKTSLAFDTLFAEGQRRYVESLSTYARRFLGRLGRAPVDKVEGLAPAIAIDQRNRSHNPRSTVATVTEIYDTLRLLYSRIGQPHCHKCGTRVRSISPSTAVTMLRDLAPGTGWLVCSVDDGVSAQDLLAEGFTRALDPTGSGKLTELRLEDLEGSLGEIQLVVDRLNPSRAGAERIADGVALAYGFGSNHARFVPRKGEPIPLALPAECPTHGAVLPGELTPRHFSFNSHLGACTACDGLGKRTEIDPTLLVPRPHRPLRYALDKKVASVVFRSAPKKAMIKVLFQAAGLRQDTPFEDLPESLRESVLYGHAEPLDIAWSKRWGRNTTRVDETRIWEGIIATVNTWKNRADWLRDEATCSVCRGGRLQPALLSVDIEGQGISEACQSTVEDARSFWSGLQLHGAAKVIAEQAIEELRHKLAFLVDVGLGYLTLDRSADTLSGGEAQRIRLATQLGARLTGTIYVLDEPTVGLHPRDTARLLSTLHGLRDLGNTLVIVEHDPEVMRAADTVIDMGPGAGEHGGLVVARGTLDQIAKAPTHTGDYLSGRQQIEPRTQLRTPKLWIEVPATHVHNLKGFVSHFPRRCLTVVTGVSGSGKSSLVMDTLAPLLEARRKARKAGPRRLVVVDQRPIGRSPRSTPATYTKVLGPIRELFAQNPTSRARGYGPGRFSFNGQQGRCPACDGRGATLVEMHFLSDVWLPCEACQGTRYNDATLQIRWRDHTIADVLNLPVEEALELFSNHRGVARRLQALADVGLGYLRLGQPANTLSGGEAQRLKLATELLSRKKETCFLLDEPTTGLHMADVDKLLSVLHRLVDTGHMVVVIEHHLDVIRSADHVIDLGPGGGEDGGEIIATGTPAEIAACSASWTGQALSLTH